MLPNCVFACLCMFCRFFPQPQVLFAIILFRDEKLDRCTTCDTAPPLDSVTLRKSANFSDKIILWGRHCNFKPLLRNRRHTVQCDTRENLRFRKSAFKDKGGSNLIFLKKWKSLLVCLEWGVTCFLSSTWSMVTSDHLIIFIIIWSMVSHDHHHHHLEHGVASSSSSSSSSSGAW